MPTILLRLLLLTGVLLAGLSLTAAQRPEGTLIDQKILDFTLKTLDGNPWSLHGQKDKKAIVLVFLSTECPMSNDYVRPLNDLAKEYGPKGVAFAAINSNPEETPKQVVAHAREYGLGFPLVRDEKHVAVAALRAEINPSVFVLDGAFVLRYQGRIDDAYSARLKKNQRVSRQDVRLALDELLSGKSVSVAVTRPFGCPIQVKTVAKQGESRPVTYHKDVAPILQARCQECHRPGEVGPFALMTYKQTARWGDDIKEYTQSRQMPPWKPTGEHGFFRDERRLTEEQIQTIARWVDAGLPEGDPKDAPPPRQFPEGWQLGEPDLVLTVPEEMTVGPSGRDLFRVFVLPTGLTEDKHVSAIEVRPRNKRVVHHTLQFIDTTGRARKLEEKEREREKKPGEQDHGPGYTVQMGVGYFPPGGSLGGWAPGNVLRHLPEGVGYHLPKGSDVVLQVHYHRTGKEEKDRTRIGLYFARKPVTQRLQPLVVPGFFLFIPAGEANYKITGAAEVNQDAILHHITPHMHLLGKDIKCTMVLPDGVRKELIHIKNWDYNWQESYFFKEPIRIPGGTKLEVEAFYDNSANNPLNPHSPPQAVRFGEQTTNEMCFVFFGATSEKPGRLFARPLRPRLLGGGDY
jgi:peroxiredoxin